VAKTSAEMKSITTGKIPVSQRALIARINRKLALRDQFMQRERGATRGDWSVYWVVNKRTNVAEMHNMETTRLESFARKVGALKPYEEIKGKKTLRARGRQ
jgi:hypothetical protein